MAPKRQDLNYLVVDDFSTMRHFTKRMLNNGGCANVDADAANGNEALAKLRAQKFDVVITDLVMPNKNGFELLSDMKADPQLKDIPVIIHAAEGADYYIKKAEWLGAAAYLVKPFTQPTLLETVDRVVAKLPEQRQAARVPSTSPAEGPEIELTKSPLVKTFDQQGPSFGFGLRCQSGHFVLPDKGVFCALLPDQQSPGGLVSLAFAIANNYPGAKSPMLGIFGSRLNAFNHRRGLAFQMPLESTALPPEFRQRVQSPVHHRFMG